MEWRKVPLPGRTDTFSHQRVRVAVAPATGRGRSIDWDQGWLMTALVLVLLLWSYWLLETESPAKRRRPSVAMPAFWPNGWRWCPLCN